MDASDTAKNEEQKGDENVHKNEMLKPRMRRQAIPQQEFLTASATS